MPKIIYRPNPTPPPFPPPGPIYDTEVHFDFEPYPYTDSDTIDLTFKEVKLPNCYTWKIGDIDVNTVFEPKYYGKIISNNSYECATEEYYYSDKPLFLYLFDDNLDIIYTCVAICDNH